MKHSVIMVIWHEGKILLGKKGAREGYLSGCWHVPGETVETGESDEETVVRGAREEAQISVTVPKALAAQEIAGKLKLRWYECKADSGYIEAGSDLVDAAWVSPKEIFSICDDRAKQSWPQSIKEYFASFD
jgi:NADH pyrophosphatase NudC (nudix superfamily)